MNYDDGKLMARQRYASPAAALQRYGQRARQQNQSLSQALDEVCQSLGMSRVVRVRVTGADARPGKIAADDVARLIVGLERSLARAAYLVLHKSRRSPTGRHTKSVEAATRLLFVGSEAGSFVQVLALPEVSSFSQVGLDLEVEDLSLQAFDRLVASIERPTDDLDPELAGAIAQLADELDVGGRTEMVALRRGEQGSPTATIDVGVRTQMRRVASSWPSRRDELLTGVLFEADFERHTARLRTSAGSVITVSFTTEIEDEIYRTLRGRAELRGRVAYDPRTGVARSIEVDRLNREEQLALRFDDAFDEHLTFEQLREQQGVSGPVDLEDLSAEWTEDERDDFLAALTER